MSFVRSFLACCVVAAIVVPAAASAQSLEVKRFNPSEWTKGRFTEVVTVNGPGRTIYQAGVARCRREAYGDGPIPANTFLVIQALAIPGMLLEIDVTAVTAK